MGRGLLRDGVPSSVEVVKVNSSNALTDLDTRRLKDYGEPGCDINAVTCRVVKVKMRSCGY